MAMNLDELAGVYLFLYELRDQVNNIQSGFYGYDNFTKGLAYVNALAQQTFTEVPKMSTRTDQFKQGLILMHQAYETKTTTELGQALAHLRHALYHREMALQLLVRLSNKGELVDYLVTQGGDKAALNKLKVDALLAYYLQYAPRFNLYTEKKVIEKSIGQRVRKDEFFANLRVGDIATANVSVGSDGLSPAYNYKLYYKITQMSEDKKTLHVHPVGADKVKIPLAPSATDEVWQYGGGIDRWLRPGRTYWHYTMPNFHFSHPEDL